MTAGTAAHPPGRRREGDVHWCADPDARRDGPWADCADVLHCSRPAPGTGAAVRRARRLLHRHPGCLLVAVPCAENGYVIGLRDGRFLAAAPDAGTARGMTGREACALASFLYGRLVTGRSPERPTTVVLSGAGRTLRLRLAVLA